MPTLFVSAFLNLFEDRSVLRSPDTHILNFKRIADTGIPIYLFLSNTFRDDYERICGDMPNVTVEYTELYEFESYTDIESMDIPLPGQRNQVKDTRNFLILMNTKLECIHRAMNKTESAHYAWIDFGIYHVLKESSLSFLEELASASLQPSFLAMPGCWNRVNIAFDKIHWRFCGGFFLGDKISLEIFYNAAKLLWVSTIKEKGLTWEVNYWAYLEERGLIHPVWYPGDHNDSILQIPYSLYGLS